MLGGEETKKRKVCEEGKTSRKTKKRRKKSFLLLPRPLSLSHSRTAIDRSAQSPPPPPPPPSKELPSSQKENKLQEKERAPPRSLPTPPLLHLSLSFSFPSSPPPLLPSLLLPSVQKGLHERRGHREARDRREDWPRARPGPGLKERFLLGFCKGEERKRERESEKKFLREFAREGGRKKKTTKKTTPHKGVALDVLDPVDRDEERPERPHGPDDEPQARPGPGPAAAPNKDRRRRRRRRPGDGQREGGPAPGALGKQGPLVEVLAQDGDGVGHGLLGDGQGGLLGDVGLF